MYKKILIPTDGSDYANREVERAEHVLAKDGEVIILSVAKKLNPTIFSRKSDIKNFNETMILEAEDNVEKMKKTVNPSINVRTKVVVGSPAETIIDVADEEDVDLIIISSSGRSGIHKFMIGSVAEKVMRKTDKDILLVPILQ